MKKSSHNNDFNFFYISDQLFTFISGALISIPITLLIEIKKYYFNFYFWVAFVTSLLCSLTCFNISIKLFSVHKQFRDNKKLATSYDDVSLIWKETVSPHSKSLFFLSILLLISFMLCVIAFFNMS